MWPVSDRFRRTAVQNHEIASTCTITTPGGTELDVPIVAGQVQVDRTNLIRRTIPSLSVRGGTGAFSLLSVPGTQLQVQHGFKYGGDDQELIPMITGELTTGSAVLGEGVLTIAIADRWQRLAVENRLAPYSPAPTASRITEIIACVREVFPGITVRNTATDEGTVNTAQAWTSRADMVASFATDGGTEAFFAPDGALVLRDTPKITDTPTWTIKTGAGGSLTALTRTRPLDRLFNTVVLTPATADPSQTWTQAIAQITDPADPRHPSRIGVRPYPYQSPTALTLEQAIDVAGQVLRKITGTTETIDLSALAMPAAEGGDVWRILTPADTGDTIVSHFLQQMTVDLETGDMSANTRSDTELAA